MHISTQVEIKMEIGLVEELQSFVIHAKGNSCQRIDAMIMEQNIVADIAFINERMDSQISGMIRPPV